VANSATIAAISLVAWRRHTDPSPTSGTPVRSTPLVV